MAKKKYTTKHHIQDVKDRHAALQLSVSMIVILILSIVIFGGGIYMVGQFFSFAEETQATVSAQAQKEIENRIMQSGEPLSIPFNKKKVLIGESHAFGLGISNTFQNTETFNIEMSFANAFDTNNPSQPLVEPDKSFINGNWIFSAIQPIENQKRNEVRVIPLSVLVGNEIAPDVPTKRGVTYVFNVCVYPLGLGAPSGLCEVDPPIPRDRIRSELHGQRIGKLYVEVP